MLPPPCGHRFALGVMVFDALMGSGLHPYFSTQQLADVLVLPQWEDQVGGAGRRLGGEGDSGLDLVWGRDLREGGGPRGGRSRWEEAAIEAAPAA